MGALSDFIRIPGLQLLQTYDLAGASLVDLEGSFDNNYDTYKIVAIGIKNTTRTFGINCRFKISGTYLTSTVYSYAVQRLTVNNTAWQNDHAASAQSQIRLISDETPVDTKAVLDFDITLSNPDDAEKSNFVKFNAIGYTGLTSPQPRLYQGVFACETAGPLSGVRLYTGGSASWSAGTIRVYGVIK